MNRITIIIQGFLIGMLFEYLLRVEVSFFPLMMIIILITGNIIDFVLDKQKNKINKLVSDIRLECNADTTKVILNMNRINKVPEGWVVFSAGQDSSNMLWYLKLVNYYDVNNNLEDIRQVSVMNIDTFENALKTAISNIKVV